MSNWWQVVAGVTNNGKEGSEGGSSNGDSTAATLSPKNEPHAGVEKVCFTYPSCQFCRTPIGILSFQAVKGEKEDEGGSLNAPNSRVSMIHQHTLPSREGHPHFYQKNFQGEPAAKRPRQHSQGPNLLVRGGGRVNNQSKQKHVVLGELGGEEKRGENKSGTESETSSPVDEPVVEEGPVEPEAQEVRLVVYIELKNIHSS